MIRGSDSVALEEWIQVFPVAPPYTMAPKTAKLVALQNNPFGRYKGEHRTLTPQCMKSKTPGSAPDPLMSKLLLGQANAHVQLYGPLGE